MRTADARSPGDCDRASSYSSEGEHCYFGVASCSDEHFFEKFGQAL